MALIIAGAPGPHKSDPSKSGALVTCDNQRTGDPVESLVESLDIPAAAAIIDAVSGPNDLRRRSTIARSMLVALCLGLGLALSEAAERTLDVYFIDVEGGQATLIVAPAGESLLVDAGYGGRGGRDPDRIMAAVRAARLDRLDYLLVSHFHPDHVGGVADLAARIPIGTFIDYGAPMGADRMATNGFRNYEPVRGRGAHLRPKPGDRLPLKGVEADVISAGGDILLKRLSGGGRANPACAKFEVEPADGTENFRSIGLRIKYGAFRFVNPGDLMGITLASLVCPDNLLGEASVYLVPHHGNYDSNVPAVVAALRPRVAIMNNGATKGGAPESFATLHRQPALEDLWQLHFSLNDGARNAAEPFIANLDEGFSAYWIKLSATEDGAFTLVNSRTGFTKVYPKR